MLSPRGHVIACLPHSQASHMIILIRHGRLNVLCGRCRQGWRCQRAVRSGQEPRVVKLRISGRLPSVWVSHPSVIGPTYLLSRMANGSIRLLHADTEDAAKVRLTLQTKHTLEPFISADGQLHLIKVLGNPGSPDFTEVCWHTVDASTGQTLASQRKLRWHPAFYDANPPYQAQTQRVLAMADAHSIAVLDAGSLKEVRRFAITPCRANLRRNRWVVETLSWSPDGKWISVILLSTSESQALSSEVQIYDAVSGRCVIALTVPAAVQLSWSPSLALAIVQCKEWLQENCLVRILDPRQNVVTEVTSQMLALSDHEQWIIRWSPAGALLIVQYGATCIILDGMTGRAIFESEGAQLSFAGATWASQVEAVFLPAASSTQQAWIKFDSKDGIWHDVPTCQVATKVNGLQGAHLSPDGRIVASWTKLGDYWRANIYHHNLETGQGGDTVTDCCTPFGLNYFANFAGWPRTWPQVNAQFQNSPLWQEDRLTGYPKRYPACLKVVEGQARKTLGSWTADDLVDLIQGRPSYTVFPCDKMSDCVWAPKGNHLAIFCNNNTWILVLTFREPS